MPAYRNLVFKGGGVRGVAYIGAIRYLYENGLMRSVERTAGTSAGALTAAILALNFGSFGAIQDIIGSLDYRKVPSEGSLGWDQAKFAGAALTASTASTATVAPAALATAKSNAPGLFKSLQCSMRLIQDKGWYSSDYLHAWLRSVIAGQFTVAKEAYTFRDFRDESIHAGRRPFFDLHVTGTDISNRTSRVFSFETTPDMEVALAVRISMSIPLFFESIPFQYPGTSEPQFYADGGVMWNYPLSIFDDPKYGRKFSGGMNSETLGFFIYTSPEATAYKEVKGIMEYVGALFESLLLVQEQLVLYGEKSRERTIFINDQGVPMTNFNIASGDAVYGKLCESGYEATREFFAEKANWDIIIHRVQTKFGWKKTEY